MGAVYREDPFNGRCDIQIYVHNVQPPKLLLSDAPMHQKLQRCNNSRIYTTSFTRVHSHFYHLRKTTLCAWVICSLPGTRRQMYGHCTCEAHKQQVSHAIIGTYLQLILSNAQGHYFWLHHLGNGVICAHGISPIAEPSNVATCL